MGMSAKIISCEYLSTIRRTNDPGPAISGRETVIFPPAGTLKFPFLHHCECGVRCFWDQLGLGHVTWVWVVATDDRPPRSDPFTGTFSGEPPFQNGAVTGCTPRIGPQVRQILLFVEGQGQATFRGLWWSKLVMGCQVCDRLGPSYWHLSSRYGVLFWASTAPVTTNRTAASHQVGPWCQLGPFHLPQ